MGGGQTSKQPYPFYNSKIVTGQLSVGLSQVLIPNTRPQSIMITSDINNTDNIYFGPTGVSISTGDVLFPGQSVTLEGYDATTPIYVISSAINQKVYYSIIS